MRSGPQPVPVGLAGKAVARHRRDDDVESVLGAAAVRGRIRERADDLELLDDRAGPAVRDDQRQRILVTGTDVDEVDVHPVDVGDELRKRVQLRFRLAPVVAVPQYRTQLLQPVQRHALRLIGFLVGPARGGDAPAKVIERRLRHLSFEGPDRAIFGRSA